MGDGVNGEIWVVIAMGKFCERHGVQNKLSDYVIGERETIRRGQYNIDVWEGGREGGWEGGREGGGNHFTSLLSFPSTIWRVLFIVGVAHC